MFEEENSEDFKVKPGSPSIDAGFDIGLTQDIFGNKVPYGNGPDIGVAENKEANNYTAVQDVYNAGDKQHYAFPNPNQGSFQVNLPQEKVSGIEILDNLGRTVWQDYNILDNQSVQVDLGNVPPGTYFLNMRTESKQIVEKITIR